MTKSFEENEIVQDPEAKILGILNEIQTMGGNDHEVGSIKAILERFKNNECTADEALREVESIRNQKQDYH